MFADLAKIEYSRVVFELEFQEPFILQQEMVLRLRREFLRVARHAEQSGQHDLIQMIDPALTTDPYARRLFQKPAPPFIIKPTLTKVQEFDAGKVLLLEVVFMGDVNGNISRFSQLLSFLGEQGLYRGEGRFELVGLSGRDQSGGRVESRLNGEAGEQLVVPRLNFEWMIDETIEYNRNLVLTFQTPARLLSNNKPLFLISFADIFPFMLRRVTSMFYAWGGLEWTDDSSYLIEQAAAVEVIASDLAWHDWRTLDGITGSQDLGGVTGGLVLGNVKSDIIFSVIALASLFNIGKSAAYGCGAFRIDSSD